MYVFSSVHEISGNLGAKICSGPQNFRIFWTLDFLWLSLRVNFPLAGLYGRHFGRRHGWCLFLVPNFLKFWTKILQGQPQKICRSVISFGSDWSWARFPHVAGELCGWLVGWLMWLVGWLTICVAGADWLATPLAGYLGGWLDGWLFSSVFVGWVGVAPFGWLIAGLAGYVAGGGQRCGWLIMWLTI